MGLHYVVAVLVVDDDNGRNDPDATAEVLLDGLMSLEPKALNGYTLLAQTSASPASPEWADAEQVLVCYDGERPSSRTLTISEVK